MTDLFTSNDRNSENKFLWWFKQVVILPKKKRVNVSCSNEHDWKEQQEKRSETTTEIEQKQFYKKGMKKWNKDFFSKTRKVNEGDFSSKRINWTEEAWERECVCVNIHNKESK